MEKKRGTKQKRKRLNFRNRLLGVTLVLFLIVIFLIGRLTWIMGYRGREYSAMALEQWTSEVTIDAKRGKILDRNGMDLAVSANVYRVDLDLTSLRSFQSIYDISNDDIAEALAEAIGITAEEVLEKLELKLSSGLPASSANLVRRIEKDQADKVRAIKIKEKSLYGVLIGSDTNRYYPNDNFLAHVLGNTNIDGNGLNGIESKYNKELSGIPGVRITEVDRQNEETPYTESKFTEPVDGKNVVLTIDEKIQYFAEKVAMQGMTDNNADAVTVIVTNPNTGEILAMANKPDFNPNEPYEGSESFKGETDGEKLQKMWRNRAVSDSFEPGSIFKIITGVAAIEEGVAGGDETYYCSGSLQVGNRTIRCAKVEGHGTQTFDQVVQNSCNPAFMEIGAKLGREKLNEYIYKFGFGVASGVDLPGESSGIVKPTDSISDIDLATIAFGQTDTTNPIQFMAAMNAAINGGSWIQPHIMKQITHDEDGVTVIDDYFKPEVRENLISKATTDRMNIALESTVRFGSGKSTYIEGYGIAGKSGTAEKVDEATGTYGAGYVASFVGFAPYDNPQISIMISVDNPKGEYYGGLVAAPLAHGLFTDIFNYIEGDSTVLKQGNNSVIIPDIRGMKVEEAKKVLEEEGLDFSIEGSDSFVSDINPKPGYSVINGSKIILKTGSSLKYNKDVIVPDLIGYSREDVEKVVSKLGIKASFEGEGNVVTQSISSGEVVEGRVTIKFTLGK